MSHIRCFFLEPTSRVRVRLRRYSLTGGSCPKYVGNYSYHTAFSPFGEEPEERDEQNYLCNGVKPTPPHDDPRWPTTCTCGYTFRETDEWQRFIETLYQQVDTGAVMTIYDAPAGAMWYAPWLDIMYVAQGPHTLMVKTPGGDWCVDAQSSNCTMKDDFGQKQHHCWIRSGEPPDITVGKDGPTCSAGAGSIQCGSYHGFLRGGYLED